MAVVFVVVVVVMYLSLGLGSPTPGIARVSLDSNMRRPADSPGGRKRYTFNRVLLLLVLVGLGVIIEKSIDRRYIGICNNYRVSWLNFPVFLVDRPRGWNL